MVKMQHQFIQLITNTNNKITTGKVGKELIGNSQAKTPPVKCPRLSDTFTIIFKCISICNLLDNSEINKRKTY